MSHGDAVPRVRRGSGAPPLDRQAANRRVAFSCAVILAPLLVVVTACGGRDQPTGAAGPYDASGQLSFGVAGGQQKMAVDPAEPLKVTSTAEDARITDVTATDEAGRTVNGELSADGASWSSTTPLTAGIQYTVEVATENSSGQPGRQTHVFATQDADAERLAVTFGPDAGTYGVAQPVTAELSEEVSDPAERAVVERALHVESEPAVAGGWYWVDDTTLHYRPKEYWPARAAIRVRSDLHGVHIRDGLRGDEDSTLELKTGERVEAVADIATLTLTVTRNGEELRTMPMTTGKDGFRTRNGKKVILGKERNVRMVGSSIGIAEGSSDYYDLDVEWAARVTWSGEYVHAAPWSEGSHGSANVSHGCTGLSDANAEWFFEQVREGDIVEYVNGYGADMDHFGNGFGDWNLSWEEWQQGSALHGDSGQEAAAGAASRLTPGF